MSFLALLKIREAFRIFLHCPLNMNALQSIRMSGVGSLTRLESDTALKKSETAACAICQREPKRDRN